MSQPERRLGEGWALMLPAESSSTNTLLTRTEIVLCRPDGSANVGAVCRAIKSMGITTLKIVGRSHDFFDRSELAKMALTAIDVFQQARCYPTLPAALSEVVLAAGLSRRRGNWRKYFSYSPEQLAEKALSLGEGRVALVLGNERTGLSDEEMQACHAACAIPTSPSFPSLNLSHAAQIIAYHFFRAHHAAYPMGMTPIGPQELEQTADTIVNGLKELGLDDRQGRHRSHTFFRDLLARAGLSPLEARRLRRLLTSVRHLGKRD